MSEVPEFPTMIQNRASLTTYLSQSHPRHSSSKSRPLLRILCRPSFCRAVRAIWKLDVQNYSKSDYQLDSQISWICNHSLNWTLVGGFNPSEKYELKLESSPNRGENKQSLEPPPSTMFANHVSWTFTAPCNVRQIVTSPVCDIVSWHKKGNSARNTVDGRIPAPVDMLDIPSFTGFYTSQVVQGFFHQQ